MSSSKNIVIIGASFAGLPAAHYLAKHLPSSYTVTLVDPSTQLYWNLASPRAAVAPELLGSDHGDLFVSFIPGFSKYPANRFTFIQGKAISTSPSTNTVTIRTCSDDGKLEDSRDVSVQYAHLIIATGARESAGSWGFKSTGRHIDTLKTLATVRDSIAAARKIVISGAGATGVELVGEIASHYGTSKEITLLCSTPGLLPQVPRADVGGGAQRILEGMGVDVRTNAKVVSEGKAAGGKLELVLSTGETIQTDVHIPTWGMTANTEYLPKELLNDGGWVVTDQFMRTSAYSNIWALGDVTHWGNKKATTIEPQHNVLVANLLAALDKKPEAQFKEYKHNNDLLMIVPMGAKFGNATGFLFGMKVWGWFGWLVKGRTYMIANNRPIAEGVKTSGGKKL